MNIREVILLATLSALFLQNAAAAESKIDENQKATHYYLYEDEPGPLYWEAEEQTDLGNLEKARELFRQSCDSGVGGSCAALGSMYQNGEGGDVDLKQACTMINKSCTLGFAPACNLEAIFVEIGQCGQPDLFRSRKLFGIACDAGLSSACGDLAEFYEIGLGGDSNAGIAKDLYGKACASQEKSHCSEYARMVLSSNGEQSERKNAIAIAEEACRENDANSCYLLAKLKVSTDNSAEKVQEHFTLARAGYKRDCDTASESDRASVCFNYYFMLARGEGGPRATEPADAFFKETCTQGYEPSCRELSSNKGSPKRE